jgi:predicted metal-binding membrane protein
MARPEIDRISGLTLDRALAREGWIVGACLALIAALAWAWLWRQWAAKSGSANSMVGMDMPAMDMSGGAMIAPVDSLAYLVSAFVMWLLMMIAMMLPSAAPMILLYARLSRGARMQGAALAPTAIFAGVYLTVWGGFSVIAALAQWLLVRSGAVSELGLTFGDRRIGGALLIVAGLYQATPFKRRCLDACRSPLSFIMRLWRPSWAGAARLGFAHGTYCLGCCAGLMALLFVFGVMNLIWVAALALFVLIEKTLPVGPRVGAGAGMVAVIAGIGLMLGTHLTPLTALG